MDEDCCEGREHAEFDSEDELQVLGYENPVIAGDVKVGDFVKVLNRGWPDEWLEVHSAHRGPGERDVHLLLETAGEGELKQAWMDLLHEASLPVD